MDNLHLLKTLPLSSKKELRTLVENRRAFTLKDFELNIFETYEPSFNIPLRFNDLVIINMITGKKVIHLNGLLPFDYSPGETLILPSYTQMNIDFPDAHYSRPTQCSALSISESKINEVVNYVNEFYPKHRGSAEWRFELEKSHFNNSLEMADATNRLFQLSISQNIHKELLADLVLKELIVRIMQTQGFLVLQENKHTNRTVFDYLKNYVRTHITEKLSVEQLAAKINMSKAALFRIFKNDFGISPMEFVIGERIMMAKELLSQRMSVKETCFSVGFNDVNYFIRLFKKRVGMTPGAYSLLY